MGEHFEEIVGLVLYGLFMLARRFLRKRQPEEQLPDPTRPAPPPRPAPATASPSPRPSPPSASPAVVVPRPWRDLDRRAADLATLPGPWGIAQAFQQAGRLFFRATTGLEPELRARMGLPRAAPLPASAETLVARQLALPMGPWMETLFADAWATLALGPAYAVGLRRTLATDDHEQAVTILASDDGTHYGAIPPPHLRLLLSCDLLALLEHRAEASRQLTLWHGEVGSVEAFLLPTRAGDWAEVPDDLLRELGARVQELIASEPLASLGGASLGALEGLRFTHADQNAAEQAAAALASGRIARVGPRVALAAALLASDDAAGHEGAILAALRRSLAPESPTARHAPERRPYDRPTASRGAFLDLSPAALREAMVARAILWR